MPLMTSHILKNLDILRTKHYFFFNKKGYFMAKNSFVAEITFKQLWDIKKHAILQWIKIIQAKVK